MEQIRLRNFRCFQEEQTARMAPLTLLVGENSTGKTSFMALVRALWDVACVRTVPDFKESPYDLGSFDDIVHYRGGRAGRAETIEAGLVVKGRRQEGAGVDPYRFDVAFGRRATFPVPVTWRLAHGDVWIEERLDSDSSRLIRFRTANGEWRRNVPARDGYGVGSRAGSMLGSAVLYPFYRSHSVHTEVDLLPLHGSSSITDEDRNQLDGLVAGFGFGDSLPTEQRPFASAPVRSRPRRTYDPARPVRDPEGENVPMYLSTAFFEDKGSWKTLKDALESFGRDAGLFDEISVRPLGQWGSEPFQMHVRKYGRRTKGPMRNLIDVGYGVSQVLPILTELFRDSETPMFLLQQPEVHLHPSAQAALGSLFCKIATRNRQLVVETHSDHLLDRVRMDVRDGTTKLKPEDVSILFFERRDLDVRIHSLRLDGEGNVLDAPPSYRRFFMEETRRSLRL